MTTFHDIGRCQHGSEVYEYFPGLFATAEGKKGDQFYTPPC